MIRLFVLLLPLGDDGTITDHVAVPHTDDSAGGNHFHVDHFGAIVSVVVERDARSGANGLAHRGNHGGDGKADLGLAAPPLHRVDPSGQIHSILRRLGNRSPYVQGTITLNKPTVPGMVM